MNADPHAPSPADVEAIAEALYRLEWDADLYATPRNRETERYERRATRLLASPALATLRAHERAEGLGAAALLLSRIVDYWDGRPTEHHGHHIESDLRDALRAIEADRDHNARADRQEPTP